MIPSPVLLIMALFSIKASPFFPTWMSIAPCDGAVLVTIQFLTITFVEAPTLILMPGVSGEGFSFVASLALRKI